MQQRSGKRYRIAYLVTHPIQYQAPLLRFLNAQPDIEVTVFFRSDMSLTEFRDKGFGREIVWDVPLLDGYPHEFLPCLGRREQVEDMLGPLNYGIGRRLARGRFDLLWVHGYALLYNWIAQAHARLLGMPTLVRDDASPTGSRRSAVKVAVKRRLFPLYDRLLCDGYLAIGSGNRAFYRENGVSEDRLFTAPYCVDNAYFQHRAAAAAPVRAALRRQLGLAPGRPVVLYAAKFQRRKRAADLIAAHGLMAARLDPSRRPYLLLAGEGEERPALEAAAAGFGEDVRFLGFRNQSELPALYDLCDLFALVSEHEPWGLAVNEVMSVGRAVVLSDQVGCAPDLVRPGINGHVVPVGDIAALADAITDILGSPDRTAAMGAASADIMESWNFEAFLTGFRAALAAILGPAKK